MVSWCFQVPKMDPVHVTSRVTNLDRPQRLTSSCGWREASNPRCHGPHLLLHLYQPPQRHGQQRLGIWLMSTQSRGDHQQQGSTLVRKLARYVWLLVLQLWDTLTATCTLIPASTICFAQNNATMNIGESPQGSCGHLLDLSVFVHDVLKENYEALAGSSFLTMGNRQRSCRILHIFLNSVMHGPGSALCVLQLTWSGASVKCSNVGSYLVDCFNTAGEFANIVQLLSCSNSSS